MDWQSITIMALGYTLACFVAYRVGLIAGARKSMEIMQELMGLLDGSMGDGHAE